MKLLLNARTFVGVAVLAVLATAQTKAAEVALVPFSSATSAQAPAPWRVAGVPGGKIPLTTFSTVALEGRKVLRVATAKSYGNLVHDLPPGAITAGMRLNWRWRLDEPLESADLRTRQGDDSPLKVCVLFDMPLEKLGLIERNLFRVARAASPEKLPSATLCYVWDHTLSPGTMLPNAYTHRVRLIVTTSGAQQLGQWVNQSRDIAADFQSAFGTESDTLPPVMAVLVGGDADNTGGASTGYVDDIRLQP